MLAPVVPLVVMSYAQIVAQHNLNAEEFVALLTLLEGKERRLMSGAPGYFASDVEAALRAIRDA